jgi:ATP-dependent exoDNAse (exonuclease V) beta subunit
MLGFLIKNSLFTIALLNEIGRIIDQIRNEQFIVHISEFNRRVAEIVFNEPAPFIFERLGDRYNHFLIDEFQDTSVMQWQNLLPLIQNGLSENAASLIVGDGKQAIYRFRGGDVEQFAQMPEPYPETLPPIQKERYRLIKAFYTPKTLDTNYRSLPEVIGFNNRFYKFLSSTILKANYQPVYAELEQKFPGKKSGGFIQLEVLPSGLNRAERDELQLSKTLKLVHELISQKGYKPRDIAIITRRNLEGTLIAARLLNAGIPVISGESLLIDSSPEVRFLLAWMRVIIGENEAVNLLHICSYLIQRKLLPFESIEQLVDKFKMEESSVMNLIRASGFDCSPNQLRVLPILESAYKICYVFNFETQKNPYLQFFLESIWNISKQKSVDIPVFLEFWEEKRSSISITLPQDANAIRVMTVHKSKGLQFPVVLLPFAYSERRKPVQSWVDNTEHLPEGLPAARLPVSKNLNPTAFESLVEEEDNKRSLDMLNLLYVATTRAEDALYIISGHSGLNNGVQSGWEEYLELFAVHEKPEEFTTGICQWGDSAFLNHRKTNEPPHKEPIVTPFDSGEWQQRIRISRQAPRMWEVDPTSNPLSEGNLLHTVLAWIIKKSDVSRAIRKLTEEGWADVDKSLTIEKKLEQLLNHPEIETWFRDDLKVRTEREMLLKNGSVIRPDRVIEEANLFTVIDYKTGIPRNEHRLQVQEYMHQLSFLTTKSIKGYLVYIGGEFQIEEVRAA